MARQRDTVSDGGSSLLTACKRPGDANSLVVKKTSCETNELSEPDLGTVGGVDDGVMVPKEVYAGDVDEGESGTRNSDGDASETSGRSGNAGVPESGTLANDGDASLGTSSTRARASGKRESGTPPGERRMTAGQAVQSGVSLYPKSGRPSTVEPDRRARDRLERMAPVARAHAYGRRKSTWTSGCDGRVTWSMKVPDEGGLGATAGGRWPSSLPCRS